MADVATRLEGLRAAPLPVTPLGTGRHITVDSELQNSRSGKPTNQELGEFTEIPVLSLQEL